MTLSNVSETGWGNDDDRPEPDVPAYELARDFNRRGLFIGGCAKSGTTLLLSLLDNHPQLVVLPEETSYLEHRRHYLGLKDHQARLEHLLEKTGLKGLGMGSVEPFNIYPGSDVRNYRQFDYRQFVSLVRNFVNRPWMNDSLLFSETIRAYGIAIGANWRHCAHWVEKTPRTESCAAAFDELFPDAKLILMVRDPRAVFASIKSRACRENGCYTEAHRLTRSWNRSAREIPRLLRNPSRFLIVRYEDLVSDLRVVLGEICRFGGFDFSERMLEPTRAGNGWQGNSAFYDAFKGISDAPVGKWKNYLTEHEIWWIELHCRKGMELADYPRQTDARFSPSQWLKRLPGESLRGYVRARRDSLRQGLGLLKECQYDACPVPKPCVRLHAGSSALSNQHE